MSAYNRSFLDRASVLIDTTQKITGYIGGAAMVAVLVRLLLEFSSRIHWVVGAVLAAAFAILVIWLTDRVRHSAKQTAPYEAVAVLALGLFTLAVVGAWISFTLHISGLGEYVVPADYSIATFVDLYMYTFCDLLPGIEVWETLGVEAPITSRGVIAGLPLLGFKVFVVWLLLDAFRALRKGNRAARASGRSSQDH